MPISCPPWPGAGSRRLSQNRARPAHPAIPLRDEISRLRACGAAAGWTKFDSDRGPTQMRLRIAVFSVGLALGTLWLLGPSLQARPPAPPPAPPSGLAHATFAGGCFWCTQASLEEIPGVVSVVSGYAGGHVKNPSYEQVSSG